MKLVNGFGVELLAFNVMFTTVGALPSFSNINSTFNPSLSTAVMGGIVGAPAITKIIIHQKCDTALYKIHCAKHYPKLCSNIILLFIRGAILHRTKCFVPNTTRNRAVTYNAAFSAFSLNLSCQKANFSQVSLNNNNNNYCMGFFG